MSAFSALPAFNPNLSSVYSMRTSLDSGVYGAPSPVLGGLMTSAISQLRNPERPAPRSVVDTSPLQSGDVSTTENYKQKESDIGIHQELIVRSTTVKTGELMHVSKSVKLNGAYERFRVQTGRGEVSFDATEYSCCNTQAVNFLIARYVIGKLTTDDSLTMAIDSAYNHDLFPTTEELYNLSAPDSFAGLEHGINGGPSYPAKAGHPNPGVFGKTVAPVALMDRWLKGFRQVTNIVDHQTSPGATVAMRLVPLRIRSGDIYTLGGIPDFGLLSHYKVPIAMSDMQNQEFKLGFAKDENSFLWIPQWIPWTTMDREVGSDAFAIDYKYKENMDAAREDGYFQETYPGCYRIIGHVQNHPVFKKSRIRPPIGRAGMERASRDYFYRKRELGDNNDTGNAYMNVKVGRVCWV